MRISISLKQLLLIVLLALGAAQFVPVDLTNPPTDGPMAAPRPVVAALRHACFDCHSHETDFPWYAKVAPVSWLVARDVNEARSELNFSQWNRLGMREQEAARKEIWDVVKSADMPPPFYVLVHADGRLNTDEQVLIRKWAGLPDDGP